MSLSRTHIKRDIGIDFFSEKQQQQIKNISALVLLKSIYLKYFQKEKLDDNESVSDLLNGSFWNLIWHSKVSFNFSKSLEYLLFTARALTFRKFCLSLDSEDVSAVGGFISGLSYVAFSLLHLALRPITSPLDTAYKMYKMGALLSKSNRITEQNAKYIGYILGTLSIVYSLAAWGGIALLGVFFAPAVLGIAASMSLGPLLAVAAVSTVVIGLAASYKFYDFVHNYNNPNTVPFVRPLSEENEIVPKPCSYKAINNKMPQAKKVKPVKEFLVATTGGISSLGHMQQQTVNSSNAGLFAKPSLPKPHQEKPYVGLRSQMF